MQLRPRRREVSGCTRKLHGGGGGLDAEARWSAGARSGSPTPADGVAAAPSARRRFERSAPPGRPAWGPDPGGQHHFASARPSALVLGRRPVGFYHRRWGGPLRRAGRPLPPFGQHTPGPDRPPRLAGPRLTGPRRTAAAAPAPPRAGNRRGRTPSA